MWADRPFSSTLQFYLDWGKPNKEHVDWEKMLVLVEALRNYKVLLYVDANSDNFEELERLKIQNKEFIRQSAELR